MKAKLILPLLFITIISCRQKSEYSEAINSVFNEAGSNKTELIEVLKYYRKDSKDSLKLQAAEFLIENMLGHSYNKSKLVDTSKTRVAFDVLDYPDYKTMVEAWDSIENRIGTIENVRDTVIYDSKIITASYLINNIDLAFKAWQNPWAAKLSFDKFCEYILPYRGSNEPLEEWRSHFVEKYKWLKDSLNDINDPIEAAERINSDLKSWFKFDARLYRHPTDLGLAEMEQTKVGRCEDMTNLAAYAMRANGIPVMTDYVTHWPTTGNNHAWNATYDKNGKVIIFMGALNNPGEYQLNNKKAKVYRKTFSTQQNCLSNIKPDYEKVPRWLRSKHYIDVTNEYIETVNIQPKIAIPIPDSINFGYLAVFNSGKWEPTAWGKLDRDKKVVRFKNLGKDIVYAGVFYKGDSLIYFNQPFLVDKIGNLHYFNPDTVHKINQNFYGTTQRAIVKTTDEIREAHFKTGATYQLYYWQNRWKLIGEQKAVKRKPLHFKQIPSKALYWLKEKGGKKEERIFSIDSNSEILFR